MPIRSLTPRSSFINFNPFSFLLLLVLLLTIFPSCNKSDYDFVSISGPEWDHLGLTKFRDCSQVLGNHYWFEEHELGVVIFYGPCLEEEHNAYTMIGTEFFDMEGGTIVVEYESPSGNVYNVHAWLFTLDLWYNPVDIEVDIIPYQQNFALGVHTFRVQCEDDDQFTCDIEHLQSLTIEDFDVPAAEE